ncbi:MAG: RNA polymerase sigma factor [Oscillibacter sp.]|nr:RNA polymerase sigma factor [Oscillibacter sp.]
MEDHQIIELYWSRNQQAIQETAGKYGQLLSRIAWNILYSHEDAEECVNDSYLRAWNAIPPTRPTTLQTWLSRIVRNLSLDRWKQRQADKRGRGMELLLGELEECIPSPSGRPETALEEQAFADLLSTFLRQLSRENRLIFLRRYWYGEPVAMIASSLGCQQGKVKSSLFRTRKALRAYLEKEEINL